MNNFNGYFPCSTPRFPLLMPVFSPAHHFPSLNFLEENLENYCGKSCGSGESCAENFEKNIKFEKSCGEKCAKNMEDSQMKFEFEEILEENHASFLGGEEILAGNSHGLDIMALGNIKAFADQSLSTASSIISSQNTINSMDSSKKSNDSKKNSKNLKGSSPSKNSRKNKRKKTRKNSKKGKSTVFFIFRKNPNFFVFRKNPNFFVSRKNPNF